MTMAEKDDCLIHCKACNSTNFSVHYNEARKAVKFLGFLPVAEAKEASIRLWCLVCDKIELFKPGSIKIRIR